MSNHHQPRMSWDIGARGVQVLAVVAVVVAAIAAVLAWQARPEVAPVPVPAVAGSVSAGGPANPPAAVSPGAGPLVVAVSGRVRHPGLVRLPVGARVADAIDAAGGVVPGTDTSSLNLARKVADGELIAVGVVVVDPSPPTGAGGPVNLNTATLDQLQTLPGVGPVLAQRIVDYRSQHGAFRSVGELRNVTGIGDAKYNDLKARVTV